MRDCVILGAGRSGTSLTAGLVASAGRHHLGDRLLAANPSNPMGYYEDAEVNAINEELLAPLLPHRPEGPAGGEPRHRGIPREGERWLARLSPRAEPRPDRRLVGRIAALTRRRPFCYKDPRFCYTLGAWRPWLAGVLFVCVVRHPAEVVTSVMRELSDPGENPPLGVTPSEVYAVWEAMYRRVLERHSRSGDWLFLHYQSLLEGPGVAALEEALGVSVDGSLVSPGLRRSLPHGEMPPPLRRLYARLCELSSIEAVA